MDPQGTIYPTIPMVMFKICAYGASNISHKIKRQRCQTDLGHIANYSETLHLFVSIVITFVITQEGGTVRCLRFCHRSECRSGKKCTQPFLYHTKYIANSVYTFDNKLRLNICVNINTFLLYKAISGQQFNFFVHNMFCSYYISHPEMYSI